MDQADKNNGNILIKGTDLTEDQKKLIKFNGASNPDWIASHSFWFKDGKPSTEEGYYYPITHTLKFLPY